MSSRRDNNINWSNQTNTSRCSNILLGDISTDLLQITLGENQPHIAHKKGNEAEEGTVVDLVRMDPNGALH
jgi:hypothetical protein